MKGKAMNKYVRDLLIWARIPQAYQRLSVWWAFHSDLRERVKALRLFLLHRSIALRNATFGSTMIVATRQIQSRDELRHMTPEQIMGAWRAGRLNYLGRLDSGVAGYGDKAFRAWVTNGGQMRANITAPSWRGDFT
jgi:hypothetical protein